VDPGRLSIAIARIAFRFILRSTVHRAEVAEVILILHFAAFREPPFGGLPSAGSGQAGKRDAGSRIQDIGVRRFEELDSGFSIQDAYPPQAGWMLEVRGLPAFGGSDVGCRMAEDRRQKTAKR